MTTEVVERLTEIPEHAWQRLAAGHGLYLSYRWLLSVERASGFESRYIVVLNNRRKLIGALPTYVWRGDERPASATYDPTHIANLVLGDGIRRDEWMPVMFVGTRSGYVNEPLADDADVVALLLERARDVARELGARSAAAMYLTRRGAEALALPGATPAVLWSAGTSLSIRGTSFEDYLRGLNSHRRAIVNRERRRFFASGVTAGVELLGDLVEQAAVLLANVQRRHGHPDSVQELATVLRAQADELGDAARVFTARRSGALLGYALAFEYEERLWVRVVGLDYDLLGNEDVYFNMCYYEPIRYAAEQGLQAVELGAASYRPKLLRGAHPYPLFVLVWPPGATDEAWRAAARPWSDGSVGWWREQLESLSGPLGPEWSTAPE